jgi:uncharacterized protein YdhG (YjbR/CyaY superfamily)
MAIIKKTSFSTVDEYLALHPAGIREKLEELRDTIRKAAPQAEEVISYSMPAFKYHGMVAWFAATKNHYGLYMRPGTLKAFKERLKGYSLTMSTVQLPYDKPLPKKLVSDLVKYQVRQNLEKEQLKAITKKKPAKK